jgi:hypothetical protein
MQLVKLGHREQFRANPELYGTVLLGHLAKQRLKYLTYTFDIE